MARFRRFRRFCPAASLPGGGEADGGGDGANGGGGGGGGGGGASPASGFASTQVSAFSMFPPGRASAAARACSFVKPIPMRATTVASSGTTTSAVDATAGCTVRPAST